MEEFKLGAVLQGGQWDKMTIRRVDNDGNDSFGNDRLDFETEPHLEVEQLLRDNLKLMAGEWFLDSSIGLDYTLILGQKNRSVASNEIKRVIDLTRNVQDVLDFNVLFDTQKRSFSVNTKVAILYDNNPLTFKTTLT